MSYRLPKRFRPLRVYADTSVFGGVFDEEFAKFSRKFFKQVAAGQFTLVISALIEDEIESAPIAVKELFKENRQIAEIAEITPEAISLQESYISAGVVSPKWEADALHVALASVSRCNLIVSLNFSHIVHFDKKILYNTVNKISGYNDIVICSPPEVISYAD